MDPQVTPLGTLTNLSTPSLGQVCARCSRHCTGCRVYTRWMYTSIHIHITAYNTSFMYTSIHIHITAYNT